MAELIAAHGPERVVVSLDARGLEVATHGWAQGSGVQVAELTPRLADAGLETLIFTDVTRDGTLKGLDRDLMRQVRGLWINTLIVGGGVANLDDVRLLQRKASRSHRGPRHLRGHAAVPGARAGLIGVWTVERWQEQNLQTCAEPLPFSTVHGLLTPFLTPP